MPRFRAVMQFRASPVFAQGEMYMAKTFARAHSHTHIFTITYCYNFSPRRIVESAKGRIVRNARVNLHVDPRKREAPDTRILQSIFFLIYSAAFRKFLIRGVLGHFGSAVSKVIRTFQPGLCGPMLIEPYESG